MGKRWVRRWGVMPGMCFVGALLGIMASLCVLAPPAGAVSSNVVISEVLTRGVGGASDEFVELYNLSRSPVDISGWSLDVFDASTQTHAVKATIPPNSTPLGAGCHYLIAGTAYAANHPATPDLSLNLGLPDAAGIALRDSSSNVVDAVGMAYDATTMAAPFGVYAEGTPLNTVHNNTAATNVDSGLERKPGGNLGEGQDTDQNTADFQVVAPTDPESTSSQCISPLSATGGSAPATAQQGGSALLTTAVTPGAPGQSNGFTVTADLSSIGGSATQALFDDGTHGDVTAGDNTFSFDATVATTASTGPATIPVTITDAQGRHTTASIQLTISPQPASTSPPTVSGSPIQGQTLTDAHAMWPGTPTGFEYQWEDCDGSGLNCSSIVGATAPTYLLTSTDVGHTLEVQETASYADGPSIPASSSASGIVQAPPISATKPSDQSLPVITGTPTVGRTLSASAGTWSGTAPLSYAYQWQRCKPACVAIEGATASAYTPTGADVAARLAVVVTARNSTGTESASSTAVGPVTPAPATVKQINALLLGELTPTGHAAGIVAISKAGGYTLSFTAPGPGSARVDWYYLPPGARLASAKPKAVLVATGTANFSAAGSRKLKVQLTAGGKHLLTREKKLHANHLKLTGRATFTPAGNAPVVVQRTFALRP